MSDTPSSNVAFSKSVKAEQARMGSRALYEKVEAKGGFRTAITDDLDAFIAHLDFFYLASASADGQPYIQHRGGPKGFLKVLDGATLGFADFSGNRQYITVGNLAENDRVQLFLMDYANRRRIKIWGRGRVVENSDDADLLARLGDPAYEGTAERAIVITVTAWDANCPRHIEPRYTEEQVLKVTGKLESRIEELEAEIARLK